MIRPRLSAPLRVFGLAAVVALGGGRGAAADELAAWDLDNDDGAFIAEGSADQWEWGPVSSGPMGGYDAASCWGTKLDRDYYHSGDDTLTLASTDLSEADHPVLVFAQWFSIDAAGDVGRIEFYDGEAWSIAEPVYGYPEASGYTGLSDGWTWGYVDLTGLPDTAWVRFAFEADASGASAGRYLDAVSVVDGDPVPPEIEAVDVLPDTQTLDGPYSVSAVVFDDQSDVAVDLIWSSEGGADQRTTMTIGDDDTWTAEIPGQAPDQEVTYWVEASDGTNVVAFPPTGTTFRVFLAPPTNLETTDERVVGTAVTLDWLPPDSEHPVVEYRIYRDDTVISVVDAPPAQVPIQTASDELSVAAVFEAGGALWLGDRSEALILDAAIPSTDPLEPDAAWQGEQVHIQLTGNYLLLDQADASLDLGDDIELVAVSVTDVDHAVFTVEVGAGAAVGVRDAVLLSGDMALALGEAFEVLDGSSRPSLLDISPDTLSQGDIDEVEVELSAEPAGAVVADLGPGVIVESVTVEGTTVRIEVAVANDATPGSREVTLDDGVRLLEGVDLRVRARTTTPASNCAHGSGSGLSGTGAWWLALLAAAIGRRRKPAQPQSRRTPTSSRTPASAKR